MPTNGRGDYAAAILVWRWRDGGLMARSLAHRLPVGWTPAWVAMVPEGELRPDWVPAGATAYALPGGGDTAYCW